MEPSEAKVNKYTYVTDDDIVNFMRRMLYSYGTQDDELMFNELIRRYNRAKHRSTPE